MDRTTRPLTRRLLLRSALVLSLMPMSPLRSLQIDEARAEKKTKKKKSGIKEAVKGLQELCGIDGGTSRTVARPGGTTVYCEGTRNGDWACTASSKGGRCHATAANPGATPNLQQDLPFSDPNDIPDMPLEPAPPISDPGDTPETPLL